MSSLILTVLDSPDIVMSAISGATDLGVTGYQEPAVLANVNYAPQSPILHGQAALSWSWQQSLLSWSVCPFGASSETEAEALIAELRASLSRTQYEITRELNGSTITWRCDPGSVTPAGGRSLVDLKRPYLTQWNVAVPMFPVPVS